MRVDRIHIDATDRGVYVSVESEERVHVLTKPVRSTADLLAVMVTIGAMVEGESVDVEQLSEAVSW